MNKKDLKDLTFIIPCRIESIIRLENLLAVIRFINMSFHTHIVILEASPFNNKILQTLLREQNVKYIFIEDNDIIFHRTHYINYMAQIIKSKYIAIWDADVILCPEQIWDSILHLRNGYDVAYPYDGDFFDTSLILRTLYLKTNNVDYLKTQSSKMILPYGKNMTGGAVIVNRKSYIMAGMENELFYGWGPEDLERYMRWKNTGYKIYRSTGCLYHLTHPRNLNGQYNSTRQIRNMQYEIYNTINGSPQKIRSKITKSE